MPTHQTSQCETTETSTMRIKQLPKQLFSKFQQFKSAVMFGPGDASCNSQEWRRGASRRRSRRRCSGVDYGAHGFACVLKIIIYVLLWCDKFLLVALRCRGGSGRCPMAISDFVLLHNKAADSVLKVSQKTIVSVMTSSPGLQTQRRCS